MILEIYPTETLKAKISAAAAMTPAQMTVPNKSPRVTIPRKIATITTTATIARRAKKKPKMVTIPHPKLGKGLALTALAPFWTSLGTNQTISRPTINRVTKLRRLAKNQLDVSAATVSSFPVTTAGISWRTSPETVPAGIMDSGIAVYVRSPPIEAPGLIVSPPATEGTAGILGMNVNGETIGVCSADATSTVRSPPALSLNSSLLTAIFAFH